MDVVDVDELGAQGLVARGLVARGFVARGFVARGFVARGIVARGFNKSKVASATSGLILFMLSGRAEAYHTEDDRQTDFSAYTLRRQQFRLGLFQEEYGVTNWCTLGTYSAPWLVMPWAKAFNGDLYAKFKIIDWGRFAWSVRGTVFYLRIRDLPGTDNGRFAAVVAPLNTTFSYVFGERWTSSVDLAWVKTHARAQTESDGTSNVLGVGLQETLQLGLSAEYRVSRVVALNLVARYVPWARSARFETTTSNDSTTVEIDGKIDAKKLRNSWMIQPGVTFSWARFNLQFGLGYGDLFVPGLRLVAARKFILPDLDFYFRF